MEDSSCRGTRGRFSLRSFETLFLAIWSANKALLVHFRLRYNIFICSVILGELASFRNY